jgi:hypothetical protein
MSPLATFLKNLDREKREQLTNAADTSIAMLDQYAGDHKRPGYRMSQRLVVAAGKLGLHLTLNDCRPDIWKDRKAA